MFKKPDSKFLAAFLFLLMAVASARAYEPTSNYEIQHIRGWNIEVNKKVLTDTPLATNVLQLLDFQLFQITRVVPEPALARLRDVTIWVELNDPLFPGMCYHPSGGWLRQHDLNPEKATGVEISNATNFLTWTKEQPWMVLHELAHSYYHRVLGYDNPEIKAAYQHAVESKTYDSILRINGHREKHYAMNNEQEYFAECSEAFFGVNDFYPFVRAELKEHDPEMFTLLQKVWGTKMPAPRAKASSNSPPASASPPR